MKTDKEILDEIERLFAQFDEGEIEDDYALAEKIRELIEQRQKI
jgi:hypothetical protein